MRRSASSALVCLSLKASLGPCWPSERQPQYLLPPNTGTRANASHSENYFKASHGPHLFESLSRIPVLDIRQDKLFGTGFSETARTLPGH
ncbi:hypothetical protein BDW75DRAFT_223497 [Aspergillus navahoensis]